MNWEVVSATAELLGALAVLATLVYLAVQVRHSGDLLEENRKIALGQVYTERSSQRLQDLRHAIDSPYVIPIMAKDSEHSEDDIRRRMVHQLMEIQVDTILYHNKLGFVDPEALRAAEERIRVSSDLWREAGCFIHPHVREWQAENMASGT